MLLSGEPTSSDLCLAYRLSSDPTANIPPPYIFSMLYAGYKALGDDRSGRAPLPAQVPFVTLVGVYFCALVVKDVLVGETATSQRYSEFLSATRDAACATIDENLAILPQLIDSGSMTNETADNFRDSATKMKAWVHNCAEPVSLGQIFSSARINWVWMHTVLTASNSVPLQVFLYMY